MKIELLHPINSTNTGDLVILKGTENLLREVYSDIELSYQDLDGELVQHAGVDLLIVSGTPWFWEACHRSEKYEKLKKVLEMYPKSKKVGLGLGSCYPLTTSIFTKCVYPDKEADRLGLGDWRRDDIERIRNRFERFDLLFARDRIAQEVLKTAGLESFEVVCPACFAHDIKVDALGRKPLLIFQNLSRSVSKVACDVDFTRQYNDFQMALLKRYDMDIITSSPVDSDWLRDVGMLKCEREDDGGVPYSTWIRELPRLFKILSEHDPVISCRVHDAIPSRMIGNLTYILPFDTRYIAATKVGAIPLWSYGFEDELLEVLDLSKETIEKRKKVMNAKTFARVENDKNFLIKKLRGIL